MSEDKQKHYRIQIRRLTKQIGLALKTHDHNEVSNLRDQRGMFIKALIEEFDQYFILKDGRSHFVTLAEAKEHYQDPENRQAIAVARAVSDMYQGREYCRKRCGEFEAMEAEELKKIVLSELQNQIARMEQTMNELLKDIGKAPIDFKEADASRDVDFLDGIDLSSLL
jgi:hypothetical protein